MKVWILISQGDNPMVEHVSATMEGGVACASQLTEVEDVFAPENAENTFEIRGTEMSFMLQEIEVPGTEIRPIASWSDGDTVELVLWNDGSIYAFDEKGAVVVDGEGRILSSYWRGDNEPFDPRQTIWENLTVEEIDGCAGKMRHLPDSWAEAIYAAIHYTSHNPKRAAGARVLAEKVNV
jgi:hypothetical protein